MAAMTSGTFHGGNDRRGSGGGKFANIDLECPESLLSRFEDICIRACEQGK